MAQRRPLGKTGGPTGILNINWIVKLLLTLTLLQILVARRLAHGHDIIPAIHTQHLLCTKTNNGCQLWQLCRLQHSWFALSQFRSQGIEHLRIVGCLKLGSNDDSRAARLLEGIFKLMQAIRGIDIDQDSSNFTGSKLRNAPFSAVGRPDTDTLALL